MSEVVSRDVAFILARQLVAERDYADRLVDRLEEIRGLVAAEEFERLPALFHHGLLRPPGKPLTNSEQNERATAHLAVLGV